MSQSNQQEQTEAKLLAYIEGELDEAGCAEIERHLAAHPNHRRMMADLAAGRDQLRFLPKESAPPELLENFQAQLERAALLGDVPIDDGVAEPMRIGRWNWQQVRSAAAVLLLASGLGVIVYISLPGPARNVAMEEPTTGLPTDGGAAVAPSSGPSTVPTGNAVPELAMAEARDKSKENLPLAARPAEALAMQADGNRGTAGDTVPPAGGVAGATAAPASPTTGEVVAGANVALAGGQPMPGNYITGNFNAGGYGAGNFDATQVVRGLIERPDGQVVAREQLEQVTMDVAAENVSRNSVVQDALSNGSKSVYVLNEVAKKQGDAAVTDRVAAANAPADTFVGNPIEPTTGPAVVGVAGQSDAIAVARSRNATTAPAGNYGGNEPLYVVVSSLNPDAARKQIADYLVQNNIQWDDVDRTAYQRDLVAKSQVAGSAYGGRGAAEAKAVPGKSEAELAIAPTPAAAGAAALRKADVNAVARGTTQPAGMPAKPEAIVAQGDNNHADGAYREKEAGQKRGPTGDVDAAPMVAAGPATTLPAEPQQSESVRQNQQLIASTYGELAENRPVEQLIIARKLNRRQAELLRENVHQPTSAQRANLYGNLAGQRGSNALANGVNAEAGRQYAEPNANRALASGSEKDEAVARDAVAREALAHEAMARRGADVRAPATTSPAGPATPAQPNYALTPPAAPAAVPPATPAPAPVAAPETPVPPAVVAAAPAPIAAPTSSPVAAGGAGIGAAVPPMRPTSFDPVVRPGDVLRVTLGEHRDGAAAQLFDLAVSPAGTINVPTLGEFRCVGQTPTETQRLILESVTKAKAVAGTAGDSSVTVRRLPAAALAANDPRNAKGAAGAGEGGGFRAELPSVPPTAPGAVAEALKPPAPMASAPATAAPATQSFVEAAAQNQRLATTRGGNAAVPPAEQTGQSAYTTRPAAALQADSASDASDQPVDVVIVVQRAVPAGSELAAPKPAEPESRPPEPLPDMKTRK